MNLARGTVTVRKSKTDAGVRVVDMPPDVWDELAVYLAQERPGRLVFGTGTGRKESRQNVRQRLFMRAIPRANTRLARLGIEPIDDVRPHGLRRTYASLRAAVGDDVVYTSRQLGHTDVAFSLNTYAQAVKRRERMTPAERSEYDRAVEWASFAERFGTDAETPTLLPASDEVTRQSSSAQPRG